MQNQSFSARNLLRLVVRDDIADYKLGNTRAEYRAALAEVATNVNRPDFSFGRFTSSRRSHGTIYSPSSIDDDFALRKVNDNIKRLLSIRAANRNKIVPQVIRLMREKAPFHVVKLDITKFFESVDRTRLIDRLFTNPTLSFQTREVLTKLFASPQFAAMKGLPRGLSVSSTLAEYSLREFDLACHRLPFCYYYVRYVDDMLFFCHEDPSDLESMVDNMLPFGLRLNPAKKSHIQVDRKGNCRLGTGKVDRLSYLGYEFVFPTAAPARLIIGIPEKKIKKIKTRIILALSQFASDHNYSLLRDRFRFLSSNFKVTGNREKGKLYSGVFYNHRHIDSDALGALDEVDLFLKKSVFAKRGSLGRRLSPVLTNKQRRELSSYSLRKGHEEPVFRTFDSQELALIKEVWSYA